MKLVTLSVYPIHGPHLLNYLSMGTSDVKLPAFVLHVRVAISQRDAVEFPKEIIVLKSAMQWSKNDVIKSHRHLSNAFPPTVRCTAFPTP